MAHIMNNTTATATGNDLSPMLAQYYYRKIEQNMKPQLIHARDAQKRPLPLHNGRQVHFRRYKPLPVITTALSEGITPDGQALDTTEFLATIQEYGAFVETTNLAQMVLLDNQHKEAAELLADQAALSIDTIVREALMGGLNILYAGGKTARSALAPTNKLTSLELRKAVRSLEHENVKRFSDGYFHAIIGPGTQFDLQTDESWLDPAKYQSREAIQSGEIGVLYGVKFFMSSNAKVFKGAGASSADVAATLVYGQNAFGTVELDGNGKNIEIITKAPGSSGTNDPLNQRATVGWKVKGFCAKILRDEFLVRIEHGVSA